MNMHNIWKIEKLRLDSTIIKNRNLEKKYKDSIQMERHMKIKLEVAARAVLNEERRCKEMKDQIIRLENTINELAGALKDARQIIVENGLVPIIPSQKKNRKKQKRIIIKVIITRRIKIKICN